MGMAERFKWVEGEFGAREDWTGRPSRAFKAERRKAGETEYVG